MCEMDFLKCNYKYHHLIKLCSYIATYIVDVSVRNLVASCYGQNI